MSWLQAVVLGIVQGVTEFLPISSSAHLILTSRLLGWPDQGLAFDMAAHAGSLAAVIACFAGDWRRLVGAALGRPGSRPEDRRLAWMLAAATVPVAAAGLVAQGLVAAAARRLELIAVTSVLFGLLLGWADRRHGGVREVAAIGWRTAIMVGLAQALALVPGTSRAGVTITAGLLAGLSRSASVRFSFLLAVPVGLLVAAKDLVDLLRAGGAGGVEMLIGFVAAGLSAFAAIRWLLRWVRRRDLMPFVVYRVALGLVLLVLVLAG